MSLVKQLWIAIIGLMILVFFASFSISTLSAKGYYIEQLSLKNSDNANSLALMISQMDKEDVMVELLVAAQFDTGNYKKIELLDPSGQERVVKVHETDVQAHVPNWFKELVPIKAGKGVAQIQDGWKQYGTLIVESDDRFAYESLWKTTLQFLLWFLFAALLLGAIGTWVLRYLTSPLEDVVKQAEAIGGRRFITSQEPKTLEFNRLVRAMNTLSARVRSMLENESRRLDEMRYKSQHDPLTGLANREFFVGKLESILRDEDKNTRNGMLLIRICDLLTVNKTLGHQKTDQLLKGIAEQIGNTVKQHNKEFDEYLLGRLNGSDFAVILTAIDDLQPVAKALEVFMSTYAKSYAQEVNLQLPMAACTFKGDESRQNLFQKIDSLLVEAESEKHTAMVIERSIQAKGLLLNANEWRTTLLDALSSGGVVAQLFPVVDIKNRLLHSEAMMRLNVDGKALSAGDFLPWARRLNLLPQMDLALAEHILGQPKVQSGQLQVALNLSIETLKELQQRDILVDMLKTSGCADKLWLELPERAILDNLNYFIEFCELVKPLGCKVGLDKAGSGFGKISRLQEVGLDYIKVDAVLIQDISRKNSESEGFVRGACTLGHSIGLQLIAEGLQDIAELNHLEAIGLDGATGPGVPIRA
ncbi:diguanylate phosphodiesterase [Thiosulfatimonas sediminis]|uniref:Diguanylate phosphodiesterase n=1 Tax=Thiosulfatimonas sediminis TaxID=2675054 RepID=A0A6F8PT91_9GAMM|nr:LapD/MoxY N-terminal periplasmic domain-containing protein [Thiosulfatimonas sediminis]BBP45228.1 diguanylate phosphodiesterase [Thiosulfatimonas sediminis]